MAFEFLTYGKVHYTVEDSLLSGYTHDMIFWPADGSIQTAHIVPLNTRSNARAWLAADEYAQFSHDQILKWCQRDQEATREADFQLNRELYT